MSQRRPEVVVVGAGIIGASVAHRLAGSGARVTVVEARRPAGGTSLATFAWVNAVGKQPRAYFDLNVAGMEEHRRLLDELGDADWYHGGGNLEWSTDVAALEAKVSGLREWGYAVDLVDRSEAAALEPGVVIGEDDAVALYRDDGWVDVARLVGRLLDVDGVQLVAPSTAARIVIEGGRASGVALEDGRRIGCDAVVVCTGPRSAELAGETGFELPMRHAPGLLVTTEPAPTSVRRILHVPGLSARPDGAGRLLLASDGIDKRIEPAGGELSLEDAAAELGRRALAVVPRLAGVALESRRVGLRALTADGLPAVGPLPGTDGVHLAVLHSGITLGPLVGRLVARELISGDALPELDPYRLQRFSATPAS